MSARIITIANQKGGVGKTTATMNLGTALAMKGHRVLLIDSDPQANLTSYLGVTPGESPYDSLRTLDEVYLAKRPVDEAFRNLLIAKTENGVDLIASDRGLTGVEHYLFSRPERELVLSLFLEALRGSYDFILIDTPPSLNLLTINAFCASNFVLVPVQTEFFSLEGIVKIREAIEDIKARWNPRLSILGVLPSQVSNRRKLTREVLETLRANMGEELFNAMIQDSAAVAESSGHALSVMEYDRSCVASKNFMEAAEELVRRCSP